MYAIDWQSQGVFPCTPAWPVASSECIMTKRQSAPSVGVNWPKEHGTKYSYLANAFLELSKWRHSFHPIFCLSIFSKQAIFVTFLSDFYKHLHRTITRPLFERLGHVLYTIHNLCMVLGKKTFTVKFPLRARSLRVLWDNLRLLKTMMFLGSFRFYKMCLKSQYLQLKTKKKCAFFKLKISRFQTHFIKSKTS